VAFQFLRSWEAGPSTAAEAGEVDGDFDDSLSKAFPAGEWDSSHAPGTVFETALAAQVARCQSQEVAQWHDGARLCDQRPQNFEADVSTAAPHESCTAPAALLQTNIANPARTRQAAHDGCLVGEALPQFLGTSSGQAPASWFAVDVTAVELPEMVLWVGYQRVDRELGMAFSAALQSYGVILRTFVNAQKCVRALSRNAAELPDGRLVVATGDKPGARRLQGFFKGTGRVRDVEFVVKQRDWDVEVFTDVLYVILGQQDPL